MVFIIPMDGGDLGDESIAVNYGLADTKFLHLHEL